MSELNNDQSSVDGKEVLFTKTIMGLVAAVVPLLVTFLYQHGIQMDAETLTVTLTTIAGTVLAVIGRTKATAPITSIAGYKLTPSETKDPHDPT